MDKWYLCFVACVFSCLTLIACGSDDDGGSAPPPPPPAQTGDPSWDAVKPIVVKACVKCHDGIKQKPDLSKKAAFKTASVKAAIKSGRMPPVGSALADADKTKLLTYLEGD